MKKIHVVVVAVLLGAAAMIGVAAATRSAHVAAAAPGKASNALISDRTRRLDRIQRQVRLALRDKPPALPAVPAHFATQRPAARVIYQRPSPLIVIEHRTHHDDGESESGDD